MILLDTNVISEPLKPDGDNAVLEWLDAQAIETLYLSTISLAELRFGIAAMPDGKRKNMLQLKLEESIFPFFAGRILPFDDAASQVYARIRSSARKRGLAIAATDGFIAAIAATHTLAVATRDTTPFEAVGLQVINPWKLGSGSN
jgi:toxin FitB